MSVFMQNFNSVEVQVLNATTTSGYATFATQEGINSDDLRVVNTGPNGCWILATQTSGAAVAKNIAGGVAGTRGTYILAGEDLVVGKGSCAFLAGICDSGTAQLILHAGKGS